MSDIAIDEIMAQIDNFSYDEKITLMQAFRSALRRNSKKIHLHSSNHKKTVHTNALKGILKDSSVTLEDARNARLSRQ
ncbi:MAG: hypothetical protein IKX23_04860 [Treponema sp.]|nr:hypothetical protein [Treponema sp.]